MNAITREESKCGLAAEILRSRGTLRLRAAGVSMLPSVWPGDLVTIERRSFDDARPGDIVLCLREQQFLMHRVLTRCVLGGEAVLIARGDCMVNNDPPVRRGNFLGVLTGIQRKSSTFTPARQVSLLAAVLAWMLCHWNLCRRIALKFQNGWNNTDSGYEWPMAGPAA